MSVIASSGLENDEDMHLPQKLWDDLHTKGFDGIGEKSDDDDSSEESEESDEDYGEEGEEELENSDASSIDSKLARTERMAKDFEDAIENQRDYQMNMDRKFAKNQRKKKHLIEQQRL